MPFTLAPLGESHILGRIDPWEVKVLSADELFAQTVRLEQNVDAKIRSQSVERKEYFLEAVSGFIVDAISITQNRPISATKKSATSLKRFLEGEFPILSVATEFIEINVRKGKPSGFEVITAAYFYRTLH